MTFQEHEPAFACNLSAIPSEQRTRHEERTRSLLMAIQEIQELPTGYAFRLPNDNNVLQTAMAFISYERLCCPFFRFTLEIEPEQGPVWLHLTGTSNVKPFLQEQGFSLPDLHA